MENNERRDKLVAMGCLSAILGNKTAAYKAVFPLEAATAESNEKISKTAQLIFRDNPIAMKYELDFRSMIGNYSQPQIEKALKNALNGLEKMTETQKQSGRLFKKLIGKDIKVLDDMPDEILAWIEDLKVKISDNGTIIEKLKLKSDLAYLRMTWEISRDIFDRMRQKSIDDENVVKLQATLSPIGKNIPKKKEKLVDGVFINDEPIHTAGMQQIPTNN